MTHRVILVACALLFAAGCGTDGAPKYAGEPPDAEATFGWCAFCHQERAVKMTVTGGHGSLDVKCGLCHEDLTPGYVGPGHRRILACAACHPAQMTHPQTVPPAEERECPEGRECAGCHTPHGSANLFVVREEVLTPDCDKRTVEFTNERGRADGSFASETDPGSGICEVCHTETNFYRSDGSGAPHFTSSCIAQFCHAHEAGFAVVGPPPTDTPQPTATNTPTPTVPADATPTPTVEAVTQLTAQRVATAPTGIDDPVWDTLVPFKPSLSNMSTNLLYGDGELNMSGTFAGVDDFNGGDPADLELRALHDGENIYVLAQWNDTVLNLDRRRWLYDGPEDPLKPGESAQGWTSQLNDDKISLAFEIEPASSEFGTFADAGCAASCHDVASEGLDMRPEQGKVDVWHWKTSRSEPLGHVDDQVTDPDSGRKDDAGVSIENRNRVDGGTNRSGPATEWDGTVQEFTRWDGQTITLDPAYVILDGHRMPFEGNPELGETTYASACAACHGSSGGGGIGPALAAPEFTRLSRAELDDAIAAASHIGAGNYNGLSEEEKNDLLARLRGFSGIPGYYLTRPQGSVGDIVTQSNIDYEQVNDVRRTHYRLLMIRALDTGHDDDAQFTPGNEYPFGVALMDNDGRNHVGARREILSLGP